MDVGNFDIEDKGFERVGFSEWSVQEGVNAFIMTLNDGKQNEV